MSEGWGSSGWTPEPEYASDRDDILNDFYMHALAESVTYDRITGFFASSALSLYWGAMPGFVDRGGKIRILCSPRITEEDADGIERGYGARDDDSLAATLRAEFQTLLVNDQLRKPALALAALISENILEVRLARVAGASVDDRRMFHDKVGLFSDTHGQRIGFRGSMNETRYGIASDGNIESFDAWTSWTGHNDSVRVQRSAERFEKLWSGCSNGVEVLALPAPFRHWLESQSRNVRWRELAVEVSTDAEQDPVIRTAPDGRPLREQQITGLELWAEHGHRGILAHATGSGKTVTGITAIAHHTGPALVVAPSRLVARQWKEQLEETGRRVHLCGDGETTWKTRLRTWLSLPATERVVVALAPTATQESFINQASRADNLLLVGDEVHRLGAASFRKILAIDAAARLGLSATPERAGDPEGTSAVLDYFGGVIHRYTLRDALKAGALCDYLYYPQLVRLSPQEQEDWDKFSKRIGQLVAQSHGASGGPTASQLEQIRMMTMQRARIAKKAAAKTPLAQAVVVKHYDRGQRWLVYCDDKEQMDDVTTGLRGAGIDAYQYYSDMPADKAATLRHFDENGGVIVSIKCLDEGVDIPNADHALILASSRNPREFIQRRGRVLRKADGKNVATIYDAILQPDSLDETSGISLLKGELARAGGFARDALNSDARDPLERLVVGLGGDLEALYEYLDSGEETDD
ncbi:type III restriction endonuclease subunit R [Microbacterium bovistercoris]|uniref:Type III restriction endonuclease subunit R n=1 Tax=Microbacterium bovistercoris TaxID=2293570 RepID=A0A371NWH0_9MICO|nr:DEAD/DEAH box helicase family protein [Microbacterium bovistercoris]REJ07372.1 type III restriction endonuclease subunit R [Microbacterium bovistercoris]